MSAASAPEGPNPFPPSDPVRRGLWDMLVRATLSRFWRPIGRRWSPTSGPRGSWASMPTAVATPLAVDPRLSDGGKLSRRVAAAGESNSRAMNSAASTSSTFCTPRRGSIESKSWAIARWHTKSSTARQRPSTAKRWCFVSNRSSTRADRRPLENCRLRRISSKSHGADASERAKRLSERTRRFGMTKTLRWGIIGLGWFGEIHAETLSAACRASNWPLSARAGRSGWPNWPIASTSPSVTPTIASCWPIPTIDVVSIVTHVDDHRDIAIDALRSGKHVLLEKPMAATAADCDQILAAAQRARGLLHGGAHLPLRSRAWRWPNRRSTKGGSARSSRCTPAATFPRRIGRTVLDNISALMGDGIHDGDLMLWFSEAKPVSIYAQEVHPGNEQISRRRLGHGPAGQRRGRRDRIDLAPAREHALPDRRPHGSHRHRGGALHQLRRSRPGDPRRAGQPHARHAVLAQPVRAAVRHPCVRSCAILPTA